MHSMTAVIHKNKIKDLCEIMRQSDILLQSNRFKLKPEMTLKRDVPLQVSVLPTK